jgi:uncharacterized protein YfaS (alpha-2-macroglobulin family)
MRTKGLAVLLLLSFAIALPGCNAKQGTALPEDTDPAGRPESPGGPGGRPLAAAEPTPGIHFRLSDADGGGAASVDPVVPAEAQPLAAERVKAILARLPALDAGTAVRSDFALRAGPKPPAISGETRRQAFPPEAERGDPPPAVDAGPLTLLRYAPEGDVDTMPRISLTFSKPMVPLTSHAALAVAEISVQMEPQPAGQWRWVGSRTLIFEPEGGRFPKATEYDITVPAGLKAADGQALAEASSFSFRTPPARLEEFLPRSEQVTGRQPILFAGFDQAIDRAAILAHVEAKARRERVALREATAEEIAAESEGDPEFAQLVELWSAEPRAARWIAMRPEAELPLASAIEVQFPEGLPSAEGPRLTEKSQGWGFRTYEPLRVSEISCDQDAGDGWKPTELGANQRKASIKNCRPYGQWGISFNNPLEASSVDPAALGIEPALAGRRIESHEGGINISGASMGRLRYQVTLPTGIRDVFGQVLDEGYALSFETGDMQPALVLPGDEMLLLDPSAEGNFWAHSINNDRLKVALYRVAPEDWSDYQVGRRSLNDEKPRTPPGELAWQGEVEVGGERDAVGTAAIDLGPALNEAGFGQLVVVVEPEKWSAKDENWSNRPQWRWVQVSDIGLDAFGEADAVTARVTDLAAGKPLAGADLMLYRLPPVSYGSGDPKLPAPVQIGSGRSAADGQGLVASSQSADELQGDTMLVARTGQDLAMMPYGVLGWSTGGESLQWYVFDDRGLYKPGEEAHVKGWLRRMDYRQGGDVAALSGGPERIAWKLRAPNGEEAGSGSFELTPLGGFSGLVSIPEGSELGEAWLELKAEGGQMPREGREAGHVLHIAEFRRPEFAVTTRLDQPNLIFGDTAVVTAKAEYYASGPLPGAETHWQVNAQPTQYSPPGHEGFSFGIQRPWWGWDSMSGPGGGGEGGWQSHEGRTDAMGEHRLAVVLEGAVPVGPASFQAQAEVMDVNRQAWASSASFLVHPARDYVGLRVEKWFVDPGDKLEVEAIVADIDGAIVPGRSVQLVAERVEGSWQGDRYMEEFLPAGDCNLTSAAEPEVCELRFDTGGQYRLTAEVADAEGRPNMSQLTIWVSGGEPSLPRSNSLEEEQVPLIPDADEYQPGDTARILVQAPFAPAEGMWSLRRSGLLESRTFQIDAGGSTTLEIPIEEGYLPNVQLRVDLTGNAARLNADGEPDDKLPKRPAYAGGQLDLKVPPLVRTLKVEAAPNEAAVEPGGATTVEVIVLDADGKPVGDAEVALIVVDEAVLALTGHDIGDPMDSFYPQRDGGVRDERLRRWLQLADLGMLEGFAGDMPVTPGLPPDILSSAMGRGMEMDPSVSMEMAMDSAGEAPALISRMSAQSAANKSEAYAADEAGSAADGANGADGAAPILERSDLNPLAAFLPDLKTDAEGRVTAEITVPDNVTRYRIWAVATDGGARFGKGDASLTARLPLIVRPSAPRFLNFGDRFELPVVVQNQTDTDLEVELVIRADNLELGDAKAADAADSESDSDSNTGSGTESGADTGQAADSVTSPASIGQRALIPAGDRRELRFAAAAQLPGTAVFQAVVVSGEMADAQRVSLPVWTPATTEAFATYGEIDAGAIAQPVERPPDVVEGFGGLELTTSSTAVGALTDAFLYLDSYPFEHEEAIASRLLASVALVDVLEAFAAEGMPSRAEVDSGIAADIDRLAGRQVSDGGWGWWAQDGRSSPFISVHVMHALARAAGKEHAVAEGARGRGLEYLRQIDAHMQALDYDEGTRLGMRAYALYVRTLFGDADAVEAQALYGERSKLDLDAQAWLLSVMASGEGFVEERASLRRDLANAATEEAGTAQFAIGYDERASTVILASDRRTDAIALDALMADQPDSDLIPKLVRGLLGHRVKGHWGSTQENAWVLLALDRYFRTYEAETPAFEASAWLGEGFVGSTRFAGRSADRGYSEIPMRLLPADKPTDLLLSKQGPGRLYYRMGLRYAPADLDLDPLERGFSVARSYEAIDDPDDVRRTADGTWEVKAGARIRVKLSMASPARRYHVALVDPLPAGLEAQNPELDVVGAPPPGSDEAIESSISDPWPWWRWWRWQEHEAFRDERVEAFSSLLWEGVYDYSYVARATTPGDFVVPPARAEELFHPETFGRSASDRLRVVAP